MYRVFHRGNNTELVGTVLRQNDEKVITVL